MNKEFIPYEQALALKELGFDEPCLLYIIYVQDEDAVTKIPYKPEIYIDGYTPKFKYDYNEECLMTELKDTLKYKVTLKIPTFSQAFRFFREKHSLVHEISWSKYKGGLNFDYDVFSLVLPTDDELGDEDDIASDKSMETYDSLVDKGFRHHESNTYEEAELACLNKLIEIVK